MAQGAGVIAVGLSSLLVVFHPFQYPAQYGIAFNVALVIAILWAVIVGLWSRRESFINIGELFFVLLVFGRYFDFSFRLLDDPSLVFIGAGLLLLLLLGSGYALEWYRRRLLRTMRTEGS